MRAGLLVPEEAAGLWEEPPVSVAVDCGEAGHYEMRVAVAVLGMEVEIEGSEVLQNQFSQGNYHCPKVLIEPGQLGAGEDAVLTHRSPPVCLSPLLRDEMNRLKQQNLSDS